AGTDDWLALRLHGAEASEDVRTLDAWHLPQPLARRRENRVPNRRRNSAAISAAKRGSLMCSGMRMRRRELVCRTLASRARNRSVSAVGSENGRPGESSAETPPSGR